MNHKIRSMNLVAIEKSAFSQLNEIFEDFFIKSEKMMASNKDKRLGEWLDSEDVCNMLGICGRTLQNLRRNGIVGCTKICNKTYYRIDDVEKAIVYINVRKNK